MSDDSRDNGNGDQRPTLIERLRARLWLARKKSLRSDLTEVLAETPSQETQAEFTPSEQLMLNNVLGLRERRIGDIMIARAEIIAVQQETPIGELLQLFANAGHSRLVVYGETLDDPTGMVHIRDLVQYLTARASKTEAARRKGIDFDPRSVDLSQRLSDTKIVRRILYAPPSMPAVDLLVKMQATRIHLALVIDEYGGTDGLVSIEDIVEEIVGDIDDEHDEDVERIVALGDGSFLADARASLQEALETVGDGFETGPSADEVDTLGGLLVVLASRVPARGEVVRGPGQFDFEVIDADPRRVKRIRIFRRPPDPPKRERKRKPKPDAAQASGQTGDESPPRVDSGTASG